MICPFLKCLLPNDLYLYIPSMETRLSPIHNNWGTVYEWLEFVLLMILYKLYGLVYETVVYLSYSVLTHQSHWSYCSLALSHWYNILQFVFFWGGGWGWGLQKCNWHYIFHHHPCWPLCNHINLVLLLAGWPLWFILHAGWGYQLASISCYHTTGIL